MLKHLRFVLWKASPIVNNESEMVTASQRCCVVAQLFFCIGHSRGVYRTIGALIAMVILATLMDDAEKTIVEERWSQVLAKMRQIMSNIVTRQGNRKRGVRYLSEHSEKGKTNAHKRQGHKDWKYIS